MLYRRRPWQDELAIIDRVMKQVSDLTEPEEMVETYWRGIGELIHSEHWIALSRRNIEPPEFLITRSSRFTEHPNPWEERHRLPRLSGGLLGEIAYADRPLVIDDLPSILRSDDPAHFYLEGFQSLIAVPQYESGKGINVGISLFPPGVEFDRSAVPIMHWQASLFGRGTQSLVLRKQLSAALRELDRESEIVGEIQRSLLPSAPPTIPGFEIATSYVTSARAGGDYYDFFPIAADPDGPGQWGLFIADVSGHGTPAAVLMAITHAIAHTRPGAPVPAAHLLGYINGHLARSYARSGTFVTAFYATLDSRSRQLSYAVAGHNPPRLVRAGEVLSLDGDAGLPLGLFAEESYRDATMQLERGDVLVLYTDGISEAMAPEDRARSRELFGEERLDALLLASGSASASEYVRRIEMAMTEFTGGTAATDDRTLVVIRCL